MSDLSKGAKNCESRSALLSALAEFDREAVLSLVRPGRLREWKQRLYELRVAFEASIPIPPTDASDRAR